MTLYDSKSYSITKLEDMAGISRATLYRAIMVQYCMGQRKRI
ncbi:hypothetical protein ACIQY5_20035 [Peribacillus frigoritolerans]